MSSVTTTITITIQTSVVLSPRDNAPTPKTVPVKKQSNNAFPWSKKHIDYYNNSQISIDSPFDNYDRKKHDCGVKLTIPTEISKKLSENKIIENNNDNTFISQEIHKELMFIKEQCDYILDDLNKRGSNNTFAINKLKYIIQFIGNNSNNIENNQNKIIQLEKALSKLYEAKTISPALASKMGWKIYPIVNQNTKNHIHHALCNIKLCTGL